MRFDSVEAGWGRFDSVEAGSVEMGWDLYESDTASVYSDKKLYILYILT